MHVQQVLVFAVVASENHLCLFIEPEVPDDASDPGRLQGAIKLENVSFRYHEGGLSHFAVGYDSWLIAKAHFRLVFAPGEEELAEAYADMRGFFEKRLG